MFARASTLFVVLFFTVLAAASAVPRGGAPASSCSTGPVQCCNSVQSATSAPASILLALLGIIVGPLTGQVGVTCSPITVIGVSGTDCSSQTVCCENNSFNGVVALGCTPININL